MFLPFTLASYIFTFFSVTPNDQITYKITRLTIITICKFFYTNLTNRVEEVNAQIQKRTNVSFKLLTQEYKKKNARSRNLLNLRLTDTGVKATVKSWKFLFSS